MKFASALLVVLSFAQNCCYGASSSLRATRSEDEDPRKLQASDHVTITSPLNRDDVYLHEHDVLSPWRYWADTNKACYNSILASVPGGPSTAQFLVMFREHFVEHKGKVYASLSTTSGAPERSGMSTGGLFEVTDDVTDDSGSCVTFKLIYDNDGLGQIVASAQFDPIEIIGVADTKIWGFYPGSGGSWSRKRTGWGNAIDGSLTVEPTLSTEVGNVSGLSMTGRLFNLWGSFDKFNYARHDHIHCVGRPAAIGDWTGKWAGSRGVYCPRADKPYHQLKKYTWHSSGSVTTNMGWEPAAKIGRLSPTSNIHGISLNGNPLVLWDKKGGPIYSAPLHLGHELAYIGSIGGVENGHGVGFFASNDHGRVFNIYWQSNGGWQAKEMINPEWPTDGYEENCLINSYTEEFFGNFGDQTYILYGKFTANKCTCNLGNGWDYAIYRFDFVGGTNRHDLVSIASQSGDGLYDRNLKERKLCL